jgi:hypothetical protein
MNNLRHAVADIKKMLNFSGEMSDRISDRDIAWKILLARSAFLETVYDQEKVPDEYWTQAQSIETVMVTPADIPLNDIKLSRGYLPDYYKSPKRNLYPSISAASGQRHIDIVSYEMFNMSIINNDPILDAVSLAYLTGRFVYIYPDIQYILVAVIPPLMPVSIDAFGMDTDLGMSAQSLRDAILQILTKDFQLNAAAVSDIVSDMKDQLLILNNKEK